MEHARFVGLFLLASALSISGGIAESSFGASPQERVSAEITELQCTLDSLQTGQTRISAKAVVTPANVKAKHHFDVRYYDKDGAEVASTEHEETLTTNSGGFGGTFSVKATKWAKKDVTLEGVKVTYTITTTDPVGGSDSKSAYVGTTETPPELTLPATNDLNVKIDPFKLSFTNEEKMKGRKTAHASYAVGYGGTAKWRLSIRQKVCFEDPSDKCLRREWVFFFVETDKSPYNASVNNLAPEGSVKVEMEVVALVRDSTAKQGGDSKDGKAP